MTIILLNRICSFCRCFLCCWHLCPAPIDGSLLWPSHSQSITLAFVSFPYFLLSVLTAADDARAKILLQRAISQPAFSFGLDFCVWIFCCLFDCWQTGKSGKSKRRANDRWREWRMEWTELPATTACLKKCATETHTTNEGKKSCSLFRISLPIPFYTCIYIALFHSLSMPMPKHAAGTVGLWSAVANIHVASTLIDSFFTLFQRHIGKR